MLIFHHFERNFCQSKGIIVADSKNFIEFTIIVYAIISRLDYFNTTVTLGHTTMI